MESNENSLEEFSSLVKDALRKMLESARKIPAAKGQLSKEELSQVVSTSNGLIKQVDSMFNERLPKYGERKEFIHFKACFEALKVKLIELLKFAYSLVKVERISDTDSKTIATIWGEVGPVIKNLITAGEKLSEMTVKEEVATYEGVRNFAKVAIATMKYLIEVAERMGTKEDDQIGEGGIHPQDLLIFQKATSLFLSANAKLADSAASHQLTIIEDQIRDIGTAFSLCVEVFFQLRTPQAKSQMNRNAAKLARCVRLLVSFVQGTEKSNKGDTSGEEEGGNFTSDDGVAEAIQSIYQYQRASIYLQQSEAQETERQKHDADIKNSSSPRTTFLKSKSQPNFPRETKQAATTSTNTSPTTTTTAPTEITLQVQNESHGWLNKEPTREPMVASTPPAGGKTGLTLRPLLNSRASSVIDNQFPKPGKVTTLGPTHRIAVSETSKSTQTDHYHQPQQQQQQQQPQPQLQPQLAPKKSDRVKLFSGIGFLTKKTEENEPFTFGLSIPRQESLGKSSSANNLLSGSSLDKSQSVSAPNSPRAQPRSQEISRSISPQRKLPSPKLSSSSSSSLDVSVSRPVSNMGSISPMCHRKEEKKEQKVLSKMTMDLAVVKVQRMFRNRANYKPPPRLSRLAIQYKQSEASLPERQRIRALFEIKTTEESYVSSLSLILTTFIIPLSEAPETIIKPHELKTLFINLKEIIALNKTFLDSINSRLDNWPQSGCFADIFLKYMPSFSIYIEYITNYSKSLEILQSLMKRPGFGAFYKDKRSILPPGLDLGGFLIMPVQRLPRYELLLKGLQKLTPKDHVDIENLNNAMLRIREQNEHVNQVKREAEATEKSVALCLMLTEVGIDNSSSNSTFIKEGGLVYNLEQKKKTVYAYLMSDKIILTKQPMNKAKNEIVVIIPFAESKFATSSKAVVGGFVFYRKSVGSENYQQYIFSCEKEMETKEWIKEIQSTIHQFEFSKIHQF